MRKYYVSAREGSRTAILAGPFLTHEAALARVDIVARIAEREAPVDSAFAAFGTMSGIPPRRVLGKLNDFIGLSPA